MANLCSNCVVFSGDPATIENAKALFKEIQTQQETTGQWYLPPYVTAEFSHMQDIVVHENTINYETRWLPNLPGLIQIANHFNLDFVSHYKEPANGVFGEANYINGTLFDSSSQISKEDLLQLYGDLTEPDLVLKFAEHRNFEKARELFQTLDNQTLTEIDEYLYKTRDYGREQFTTDDKYIAMAFLKVLIKEWNDRPPSFGLHR